MHHATAHAAVQSSAQIARNAALLELADRLVGYLSEQLVQSLGLQTTVRRVLISAQTQRHAIARRAISSKIDSELVAQRIAEAFANARYLLLPQQYPQVFRLVGHAKSADRWLVLPLKFIRSQQPGVQEDEFWVRTAYPIGRKKKQKAQAKGLLRDLAL